MTLCIRADRVLPDTETEFAPGAVVVAGAHIAWVGPAADAPDADETVDLGAATLTPGLVNAHVHLDLSHLRGRLPYRGDFAQWIDGVRGARAEAGVAAAAAQLLDDAVKRGTTTFGDIVAPESFDAMVSVWAAAGVRARLFVEALGFRPEVADHVFAEVWELVEMRELPETLRTGISPHAPYSVSRELLAQLVAVADGHGRPLAIHVGETLEELAFIRHGIGPLREFLKRLGVDDPDHAPYGDLAKYLEQVQLSRAPFLIVHGNYLRPRSVPAGAFVVYCPIAHHFFGHPEHPVLELLQEGVRVALGSDSAASGDTIDVLSETKFLGRARPDLDARAVFRMATEWGARALDLDTGVLHVGRPADLAAFTPDLGPSVLGHTDAKCIFACVGGRVAYQDPDHDGSAATD